MTYEISSNPFRMRVGMIYHQKLYRSSLLLLGIAGPLTIQDSIEYQHNVCHEQYQVYKSLQNIRALAVEIYDRNQ